MANVITMPTPIPARIKEYKGQHLIVYAQMPVFNVVTWIVYR